MSRPTRLQKLVAEIEQCQLCAQHLDHDPRPVLRAHRDARILIVGQAPGTKVHETGIPWNDPSGKRLREWLQVSDETFYDVRKFGIVPMGFCYPGKGRSGDLPPREECAPTWHARVLREMKNVELTLLIGQYAHRYYLGDKYKSVAEVVRDWRKHPEGCFALPHPSPRNQLWLRKNDWFEKEIIPQLRKRVKGLLK